MDTAAITARFPAVTVEEATGALLVPPAMARELAGWLREDGAFRLDYLSNVTGVDYLPATVKEKRPVDGGGTEVVTVERPGHIDVVYHLYSMERGVGPLVIKQRSEGRDDPAVASLTPVFRSADFQEREVFDLFGVHFEGHPDLRRILMWDEFEDFPMRRDYREPDDYEYEPTAHADVLEKARANAARRGGGAQ